MHPQRLELTPNPSNTSPSCRRRLKCASIASNAPPVPQTAPPMTRIHPRHSGFPRIASGAGDRSMCVACPCRDNSKGVPCYAIYCRIFSVNNILSVLFRIEEVYKYIIPARYDSLNCIHHCILHYEKYGRRAAETLFTFSLRFQARQVVGIKTRDCMYNTQYTLWHESWSM